MEDTMPTLAELMSKHNVTPMQSPSAGPRSKLLVQAERMLSTIDTYKDVSELNGETTQYWWAPQSVDGKRRISARYGGKVVDGFITYADNSLPSVKAALQSFHAIIKESTDETWAEEEERRRKK